MITSYWIPQAIHAAAQLGVADALADGPQPSAAVAAAVGANPGAVHRLLRALATIEVCAERDDGRFELTVLGRCLRSDAPDSVRSWALLMGGQMVWPCWGRLAESVRTGEPAPKLMDGLDTFEHMRRHPAEMAIFNRSMEELTRGLSGVVATAYEFAAAGTVVDVGGGHGALLPAILAAHPRIRGVVFDLERCREGAERLMTEQGLRARCTFVAGDFFETAPRGGDVYLMKSVIHDWDDERSVTILRRCREAMAAAARLVLVEILVPERAGTSPLDLMIAGTDLNMLVMAGGRERTEREYRGLIDAAGLRVTRIIPTPSAFSLIEATSA
jgi:hypothetical protein